MFFRYFLIILYHIFINYARIQLICRGSFFTQLLFPFILRYQKTLCISLCRGAFLFLLAFRKQWYTENKAFGFDCQELRVGGVMTRVDSCKRRLLAYCKGEIETIEELDEPLIPINMKSLSFRQADYDRIATTSTLWGNQ